MIESDLLVRRIALDRAWRIDWRGECDDWGAIKRLLEVTEVRDEVKTCMEWQYLMLARVLRAGIPKLNC